MTGVWSDTWKTGHPHMDAEHGRLAECIDALFAAFDSDRAPEGVLEALGALMNETRHHFEREERWMATLGYPDLAGHVRSHQELQEQIEMLALRLAMENMVGLRPEERGFIQDWFTMHIRQEDVPLAEFLRAHRA